MDKIIKSDIGDEIDLSERYMVCGHFIEACSIASTQIHKMRNLLEPIQEIELSGLMESAGMVFIQSLKELGRTAELFTELSKLFGSVEAIPIQVFLIGACMQISEVITLNLTTIFEKFLKKWRYTENDHYVLHTEDPNIAICPWQSTLDSKKYVEVFEVFTMILLGKVLGQPELAISFIDKSDLPEDKRQDMLRRLHSIHHTAKSCSSISLTTVQTVSSASETSSVAKIFGKSANSADHINGHCSKAFSNSSIKQLAHRSSPFWWFSNVRLKFGGIHRILPRGRIVLVGLVMAIASYYLKKRAGELKKFAWRQLLFIQRALLDAWQLAFSVQVNPLAAVQQISATPRSIV